MSERSSVDEIQNSIDIFTKGLSSLDKKQYDKVYSILKDISLDQDGKIKPTLENLKIIQRVNNQLGSFVDLPMFQDKVVQLATALNIVQQVQTKYYKSVFDDFTQPKTIDKINELSFDTLVDQLTKSGIDENVVNVSSKLVEQHIRDGASFSTLVDELKTQMMGNDKIPSRLISYSKQIINDTMSGFARNYHAIITNDLDLEWFEYVGALVASSRPMCIVLVAKQYIHKSEFPSIARGFVNGFPVGREGFMPNTTGANFIYRCAGFNCEHQCVPVPKEIVPTAIRTLQSDKEAIILVKEAQKTGQEVQKTAKEISKKYDASITPLNFKSQESISRKVMKEYDGDTSKVKDGVRTTIISSKENVNKTVNDLKKDASFVKYKAQTKEDEFLGYTGNIINVKTSSGLIAEIQVNTPKMIYAKEVEKDARRILGDETFNEIAKETNLQSGLGHKFYEQARQLDVSIPNELKQYKEIDKVAREYYSNFY